MVEPSPFIRLTARLIVLDPAGRILLFKVNGDSVFDPADPLGQEQPRVYWITPGGGVEPGETFEEAARRELFEEAGVVDAVIGPCVLERDKLLQSDGRDILFRERYFCAHVASDATDVSRMGEAELAFLHEHRWWAGDELVASGEIYFPEELPRLVDEANRLRGR